VKTVGWGGVLNPALTPTQVTVPVYIAKAAACVDDPWEWRLVVRWRPGSTGKDLLERRTRSVPTDAQWTTSRLQEHERKWE